MLNCFQRPTASRLFHSLQGKCRGGPCHGLSNVLQPILGGLKPGYARSLDAVVSQKGPSSPLPAEKPTGKQVGGCCTPLFAGLGGSNDGSILLCPQPICTVPSTREPGARQGGSTHRATCSSAIRPCPIFFHFKIFPQFLITMPAGVLKNKKIPWSWGHNPGWEFQPMC